MIKKLGLVGAIALVALALALPVSAASASWTLGGSHIASNQKISATGLWGFFVAAQNWGFSCSEVHIEIELDAGTGTTGRVLSFDPTEASCFGTGIIAACKIESATPTPNWPVTVSGGTLVINGWVIVIHYKAGTCPVSTSTIVDAGALDSIIATPNSTTSMEMLTLSGKTNNAVANITGEMEVAQFGYGWT